MAEVPDESAADEIGTPETVETTRRGNPVLAWSAPTVSDPAREEGEAVVPELDLAAQELDQTTSSSRTTPSADRSTAPSSDRGAELEQEHWRERAIVWRERAMAAELVAKMLQRNLDDLRTNLEDLRRKVEAAEAANTQRAAAIAASESPWRRFVHDLYQKYLA